MTEPESTRPSAEPESNAATTAEAPEPAPEPAPVPWTPERVTEWNHYYDIYVALGLLLLVFVVSATKITNASLWPQLRAGQVIMSGGTPLTTDTFSYTEEGRRWVNVPWLFEWSHYALYKLGYDLIFDKHDPGASTPKAEQVGAGVLVAVSALVRVLAALVLLLIRRSGPGLWWSAVCVALALGAIVSPSELLSLGGIAAPGQVAPATWGLLMLSVELFLLHRSFNLGRRNALWGLLPLFLIWANVDESFLIGLFVLAASVLGLLDRRPVTTHGDARPTLGRALAVLGACAAVCLLNPSFHHIYGAAAAPLLTAFQAKGDVKTIDQLSFFSQKLQGRGGGGGVGLLSPIVGYFAALVGVGLLSFVVNLKRFSLGRFLTYALAAALWGYLIRFSAEFAVIFAVTVALNGQEWYQGRFGTEGKLGRGWTFWSVGGRLVTLGLLFWCVWRGLTGYGSTYGEMQFGFGYNPDNFEFEAADSLKNAQIRGNVLNTTRHQGDALVWRAYPQRKVYIDNRHNLYPRGVLNELQQIRNALKVDAKDEWRPLLDKYGVSVVMIDEPTSPATYQQLMQSLNWVPFYDDGNVIMFGRADATPDDLAYFKAHRLDAETLAYRRTRPVPAVDRPPTQVGWLDEIFQGRALTRPQPHTDAANRWLNLQASDPATPSLPDPAHCLLAIQEARTALSRRPDDPLAFRILAACYRDLMMQETALLQGYKLTPETVARLVRGARQPILLMNRFRQRATALNFAIQTTPPPRNVQEWRALHAVNMELFQLYLSAGYIDLARDRLQVLIDQGAKAALPKEAKAQLAQQFSELDEAVKKVQDQMNEQQEGPLQRAGVAFRNGMLGLAIQELDEADRTNASPTLVKPQLIDLYCDSGQPDKALELLSSGDPDDPALGGGEPGQSALRQARVYLLLGNYENAAVLQETRALPQLRYDRSLRALRQADGFITGNPESATSLLMTIPAKITTQATWELDLALCLLEGGIPLADAAHPTGAADHFTKALTLVPDSSYRPLIAYYLKAIGQPVPPEPDKTPKAQPGEKEKGNAPPLEEKKADDKPVDGKS